MLELSVAPMMEWTTRHQRYFARLLARQTVLYTEMVVDQTVKYRADDLERWFGHNDKEHPVVLQLGGNDIEDMTNAAVLGEQWGFDEINLNVGCPSKLVSKQQFGASLMLRPEHVRAIVTSIQKRVSIPVTVKCRLGVDDHDSYEFAKSFVAGIPECDHFIIHARKCLLNGLSTHENRTIPPLQYERVFQLVEDFPDKKFSLNGGLTTIEDVRKVVDSEPRLHGVMIGRAAYHNPCLLVQLEHEFHGATHGFSLTRRQVVEEYGAYCRGMQEQGHSTLELLKPLAGLFVGMKNAKKFRATVNQSSKTKKDRTADIESLLQEGLDCLREEDIDAPIIATPRREKESKDWGEEESQSK